MSDGATVSRRRMAPIVVMVVALVVAILAYAPTHLSRGITAGTGRFRAYSVVLGADGLMRVLICLALAVFSVKAVQGGNEVSSTALNLQQVSALIPGATGVQVMAGTKSYALTDIRQVL